MLAPPPSRRATAALRFPAISLLVLSLCLLAFAAPARAGHWVLTVTGSGSAAYTMGGSNNGPPTTYADPSQAWTAPTAPITDATAVSIPQLRSGYDEGPPPPSYGTCTIDAEANLSVTVTGTWTADTNSDNTTPPSVMVGVTSSASASATTNGAPSSATADDGYGDPAPPGSPAPPAATSATAPTHWVTGSSGTFTVSLTLKASGIGTASVIGTPGCGDVAGQASVGPVTITIHAQPYDWHINAKTDNGDGTLSFNYWWNSTDGNIADLGSCYWHERVTYPGSSPYIPPAPFNNPQGYPNPTISPGMKDHGGNMATTYGIDTQVVWPLQMPYTSQTVTANQRYEFYDSATGEDNVLIPGPDSAPTITRTIGPRSGVGVWYSCTKSGETAWLQLQ